MPGSAGRAATPCTERASSMSTRYYCSSRPEIHLERGDFGLIWALGDTANCRSVPGPSRHKGRDRNLTWR
jgi:hypothetical protein